MLAHIERARAAGAVGLILTLDWTFSQRPGLGQPGHPGAAGPRDDAAVRARGAAAPAVAGSTSPGPAGLPDLTVPNMTARGEPAPTFFGAYGQWMRLAAADLG